MRKTATKASLLQMPTRRKADGPEPPENTPATPGARYMLDVTKEKITYAWLAGKTEYRIAEAYGIKRPEVESVVREGVRERLRRVA